MENYYNQNEEYEENDPGEEAQEEEENGEMDRSVFVRGETWNKEFLRGFAHYIHQAN